MRTISTYCVFDEVSEIVITTLVANNDNVARKSFASWIAKNDLDSSDFSLLKLGTLKCPDTASDVSQLVVDKDIVPVSVGVIE